MSESKHTKTAERLLKAYHDNKDNDTLDIRQVFINILNIDFYEVECNYDELLKALKDMVIQYGGMIDSDVEEEARAAVLNARAIIAKCEKGSE